MRYFYLLVLVGIVGLTAYAILTWPKPASVPTKGTTVISLVNLPERYCPTQAELLYASNLADPMLVPVENCRVVDLTNLSLGERDAIYLRLPQALPLSISYSSSVARYIVSPRIGDINADNVIDERDETLVLNDLFTDQRIGDVDLDNFVTSEDLALVRLNYGVGEKRPDGQDWQ